MNKNILKTKQKKMRLSIILVIVAFVFSLMFVEGVFVEASDYDAPDPRDCDINISSSVIPGSGGQVPINGTVLGLSQGDLVCIEPGNYSANILVNVTNVTIVSLEGPENTSINASEEGKIPAAFIVTANNVTIKGFTIQNGFLGILGIEVEDLDIQDNYIKNIEAGVLL